MDGTEYITLKEAGEISGYSPDYIGQLIRRGKLTGKQVYANVAWVTTKDALKDYLSEKGKAIKTDQYADITPSPLQEAVPFAIDPKQSTEKSSASMPPLQSSPSTLEAPTFPEVERWERIFRIASMAIVVGASLFLILLFHVLSTLLDDRLERRALERVSASHPSLVI